MADTDLCLTCSLQFQMFEYILYAILTSNILLAGSAPSDGGYYRYIGPKWSKFARYYYPNQGYYFHYITEEESERSMRSQALTMPEGCSEYHQSIYS